MQSTRARLQQQYQPMIKFIGRRHNPPKQAAADSPVPHPASPTHSLPDSFALYRQTAQQHGPMNSKKSSTQALPPPGGSISYGKQGPGRSGHSLGSIQPEKGQAFDRTELPSRFQRTSWSMEEIEAIESGGASMHI